MPRLQQARSRAEVVDAVEALLQDSSNAIWSAAEVGSAVDMALVDLSMWAPWRTKEEVTATSGSRVVSVESIAGLLGIERLEYPVDKYPVCYRNWRHFGDLVEMVVSTAPEAGETVRLYCRKVHNLDAVRAASTAYVLGDCVAPAVANGYRYECTTAGTTDATAPTWGTTVGVETTDGTAKWTCIDELPNTLGLALETLLIRLAACMAVFSKSTDYLNAVNQGGARAPYDYQTWANREMEAVRASLGRFKTPRSFKEYPV